MSSTVRSLGATPPGGEVTWGGRGHLGGERSPGGGEVTWCSRDVRLMKRRKSSPPEDTATDESTAVRQSVAEVRLSLRPRMVSPGGDEAGSPETQEASTPPRRQSTSDCTTPIGLDHIGGLCCTCNSTASQEEQI